MLFQNKNKVQADELIMETSLVMLTISVGITIILKPMNDFHVMQVCVCMHVCQTKSIFCSQPLQFYRMFFLHKTSLRCSQTDCVWPLFKIVTTCIVQRCSVFIIKNWYKKIFVSVQRDGLLSCFYRLLWCLMGDVSLQILFDVCFNDIFFRLVEWHFQQMF